MRCSLQDPYPLWSKLSPEQSAGARFHNIAVLLVHHVADSLGRERELQELITNDHIPTFLLAICCDVHDGLAKCRYYECWVSEA